MDQEDQRKQWRDALRMSSLGFVLVASVGLGVGIGWYLDQRLGTAPWGLVIFFFLGSIGGFVKVFQEVRRIS
jgi:ATP synthase protein I